MEDTMKLAIKLFSMACDCPVKKTEERVDEMKAVIDAFLMDTNKPERNVGESVLEGLWELARDVCNPYVPRTSSIYKAKSLLDLSPRAESLEEWKKNAPMYYELVKERDECKARAESNERATLQLIAERDERDEVIDKLLEILGIHPEWSNAYSFSDALEEAEAAINERT